MHFRDGAGIVASLQQKPVDLEKDSPTVQRRKMRCIAYLCKISCLSDCENRLSLQMIRSLVQICVEEEKSEATRKSPGGTK
jgi:hypothetical protein